MKNKFTALVNFIIIITMFLIVGIVFADGTDDQGNSNNPNDNERANACYTGGALEGKCDTEWEWVCGWHLIQFNYDLTSREDFPSFCMSLLPPIISPDTVNFPVCRDAGDDGISDYYAIYNANNVMPLGTPIFDDANCTNYVFSSSIPAVYTPNGAAEALAMCQQYFGLNFIQGPLGDNGYNCYDTPPE